MLDDDPSRVHARGYDDATPLHQAAWHDRVEAARALLDGGADPDLPSGPIHRNEPLGWAIVGGAAGVAAVPLEHGCRVRDAQRQDAVAGARGAFRQYQHGRPLAAWERIEELLL